MNCALCAASSPDTGLSEITVGVAEGFTQSNLRNHLVLGGAVFWLSLPHHALLSV